MPTFTGQDAFKLLSDENVFDLNADYVQPLKYGRFETGIKFRYRFIPTNMQFIPGINSPLDTTAGGWADYSELIPAAYGTYVFENKNFEVEAGLRVEYVKIFYDVNPYHVTYKSDGYDYAQPFTNLRVAYKMNTNHALSFFYNRRVDRPSEVDIRIFPKYDDAEIIKVGNPGLRPQFTSNYELGYKTNWEQGYLYGAAYHRETQATITRISRTVPPSNLIYAIFQNAGRSYSTGMEIVLSHTFGKWANLSLNLNGYRNTIEAFTVENRYPVGSIFSAPEQQITSGSVKLNGLFHLMNNVDLQFTGSYLAPDIIPQGKIYARYTLDTGIKKTIQEGKGEVFLNASDLLNTLRVKKEVRGDGFYYLSTDYYETQVIRIGYNYKF
jgi:outer membrane receptor protein involved in Fe transport